MNFFHPSLIPEQRSYIWKQMALLRFFPTTECRSVISEMTSLSWFVPTWVKLQQIRTFEGRYTDSATATSCLWCMYSPKILFNIVHYSWLADSFRLITNLFNIIRGTHEGEVDAIASQQSCLTEDLILKLAQLGVRLEKMFGSPRDVEFAVKQVWFVPFWWPFSKLFVTHTISPWKKIGEVGQPRSTISEIL